VVTVIAVGLVAWRHVEPFRQQRATMNLVKELGGTYVTAASDSWQHRLLGGDHQDLVLINVADCDEPDKYLAAIASLPRLQTLVVGGDNFTDTHLRRLGDVSTLTGLVLDSTEVTDDAVAMIQAMLPNVVVHHSQRRAIAALRKKYWNLGRGVQVTKASAQLRSLVGEDHFEEVVDFAFPTGANDDDLRQIRALRTLASLHANLCENITDDGLAHFRPLRQLKHIRVAYAPSVTDAGLAQLNPSAIVETLWLNGTGISDAGLVHMSGFPNLETLGLSQTSVTDKGLTHLRGLKNLRYLALLQTQVGDMGLAHLVDLPSLATLSLESTQITDAGLSHVRKIKNLRLLKVEGTKVTRNAVEALRRALPECEITGP
jgi:Leucine-rich repeat (LRR) protein